MNQLTLSEFLRKYPGFAPILVAYGFDLTDKQYVVRFTPSGIEVGYESDKWSHPKE